MEPLQRVPDTTFPIPSTLEETEPFPNVDASASEKGVQGNKRGRRPCPIICPQLVPDTEYPISCQNGSCGLGGKGSISLNDDFCVPHRKRARLAQRDYHHPIEVIGGIFLGNSRSSSDLSVLENLGIRYVVNVTPNLPNYFDSVPGFHYLRIPVLDHWTQDLTSYFDIAIKFIGEALMVGAGVLIHCHAGISRSVTVLVAYLMSAKKLSLEDAYDMVKEAKSSISPNFNFMGQLLAFERQLTVTTSPSHHPRLTASRSTPVSLPKPVDDIPTMIPAPTINLKASDSDVPEWSPFSSTDVNIDY